MEILTIAIASLISSCTVIEILTIVIASLISSCTVFLTYPKIKKYLDSIGIHGIDKQKKEEPKITSGGGTLPALATFIGIMSFLLITVFLTPLDPNIKLVLGATLTITIITLVGFLDDIYVVDEEHKAKTGTKQIRKGLSQFSKSIMVLPGSIPLIIAVAHQSTLHLPMIGALEVGLIYPLILVPIGVLCVANASNMLAGQNGLEAGMGSIALLGLGIFSLMINQVEATAIAFISAAALLAFEKYNWTPASILPGDSLTYFTGASIAAVVIIGNIEAFGIIVFIPWIVEAFIKASQKFQASSLGRITEKGTLKPVNDRIESLNHFTMSLGNFTEKQIVSIFLLIETLFVVLAFFLYYLGAI